MFHETLQDFPWPVEQELYSSSPEYLVQLFIQETDIIQFEMLDLFEIWYPVNNLCNTLFDHLAVSKPLQRYEDSIEKDFLNGHKGSQVPACIHCEFLHRAWLRYLQQHYRVVERGGSKLQLWTHHQHHLFSLLDPPIEAFYVFIEMPGLKGKVDPHTHNLFFTLYGIMCY